MLVFQEVMDLTVLSILYLGLHRNKSWVKLHIVYLWYLHPLTTTLWISPRAVLLRKLPALPAGLYQCEPTLSHSASSPAVGFFHQHTGAARSNEGFLWISWRQELCGLQSWQIRRRSPRVESSLLSRGLSAREGMKNELFSISHLITVLTSTHYLMLGMSWHMNY